jgi:F-type H+-transporting ATPase subunit b
MNFSWTTFVFEALNFVVLAYVLYRVLYHPLRDAIDKRRQANAQAQATAAKAQQEAEALKQQLQKQLAETEQERQQVLHEAHARAAADRKQVLAAAEATAQRRQEEVRQALDRERQDTLAALRDEVVGQAVALTGRLLGSAVDRTLHRQLALRLIDTLNQLPDDARQWVRSGRQSSDEAVLESAEDVDPATRDQITQAVLTIVGHPIALTVEHRPELLAGVRLRVAGQVWDSSLAGQLVLADGKTGSEAAP